MELSKKDTKMMQGLSVLAMLCLHLFDRDFHGLFRPLIFVAGTPLSFYFGQISDFCVMGFAFCSGYSHMAMYRKPHYYQGRCISLLILLVKYWVVLCIFSAVSICVGNAAQMPGSVLVFVRNVFLLDNSYNGAWWYLGTYAVLVLISPLVLSAVKRLPVATLGLSFLLYCASYYLRFRITFSSYILSQMGPFGMTLFEYVLGAVFFRQRYQTLIGNWGGWSRLPDWTRSLLSAAVFILILYGHTRWVPSLFIAPATGLVILLLFHDWEKPNPVEAFFIFIGQHSTNIWLTHMFFYLTLFEGLVYKAVYPPLIYLLMLGITVTVSMMLTIIQSACLKPLLQLKNRLNHNC